MTTLAPESGRTKVVSPPEPEMMTARPLETVELPIAMSPSEFSVKVEPPFVIIATVVEAGGRAPASLFPVPGLLGPIPSVAVGDGKGLEDARPLFGRGVWIEELARPEVEDGLGGIEVLVGGAGGFVEEVGP